MRHRKYRHRLGMKKDHRTAVMANLASALLEHGRIRTTLPKAKVLRPYVERVISLAKRAQGNSAARALYLRRLAISRLRNKAIAHHLFEERVEQFSNRNGGYCRIYKLGHRAGDATEMAIIELIEADDEGYSSSRSSRRGREKGADESHENVATAGAEKASPEGKNVESG